MVSSTRPSSNTSTVTGVPWQSPDSLCSGWAPSASCSTHLSLSLRLSPTWTLMRDSHITLTTNWWDPSMPGSTWSVPSSGHMYSSAWARTLPIWYPYIIKVKMIFMCSGMETLTTPICFMMRRIWGTLTSDIQIRRSPQTPWLVTTPTIILSTGSSSTRRERLTCPHKCNHMYRKYDDHTRVLYFLSFI